METTEDVMLFVSPLYPLICITYVMILVLPPILNQLSTSGIMRRNPKEVNKNTIVFRELWILSFAIIAGLVMLLITVFLAVFLWMTVVETQQHQNFYEVLAAAITTFDKYLWKGGRFVHAYFPVIWSLVVLAVVFTVYSVLNKDFARKMLFPGEKKKTNLTKGVSAFRKQFLTLFFMILIFTYIIVIMPIQKQFSSIFYVNIAIMVSILAFGITSMSQSAYFVIPTIVSMIAGFAISVMPIFAKTFEAMSI